MKEFNNAAVTERYWRPLLSAAPILRRLTDTVTREAVNRVISLLDSASAACRRKNRRSVGHSPVAEESGSFRINDNRVIDGAESRYFDKVPMKFADYLF